MVRGRTIAWVTAAALVVGAALAGCPAAHNDYPGTACKVNSDCYVGEVCQNNTICVPATDMAITGDFAHTVPPSDGGGGNDMAPSDMTPGDDL